jgi:hypothetical protein
MDQQRYGKRAFFHEKFLSEAFFFYDITKERESKVIPLKRLYGKAHSGRKKSKASFLSKRSFHICYLHPPQTAQPGFRFFTLGAAARPPSAVSRS